MQTMDDMELVREYAEKHAEGAFTVLVERHARLVYSAAFRQVRDAGMAEEITQTVFMILARKASRLRGEISLAGWLYRTTRFAASECLRAQRRRLQRELQATPMDTNNAEEPGWERIAPVLDEAMAQLGEKDRLAVLLRFFEGKPLAEIGATLGISEDSARMRVNRAVEKLRSIFRRRGVALSSATLGLLLTAHALQAAPAIPTAAIAAVAIAKTPASLASTLSLVKGTLKLMAWTKLKTAACIGTGILLVAGTASLPIVLPSHSATAAKGDLGGRVEQIVRNKMAAQQGKWNEGMRELWSLGPEIVPYLADLAKPESPTLVKIRTWYRARLRQPFDPRVVDRAQMRKAALHALAEFGPLAVRRAAPEITAALKDEDNHYAVQAARWLLPESASARTMIEAGLSGTNASWPEPRKFLNLNYIVWSKMTQTVPVLSQMLTNPEHAGLAAFSLGQLNTNAIPAIPALIQTLEWGVAGTFVNSEQAHWFHPSGKKWQIERLPDEDISHNRAGAAAALGRIGVATPEVCQALALAWNAPEELVRDSAAEAVALLGVPMTNHMTELLQGMLDTDSASLAKKLVAMQKLARYAQEALPVLRELTDLEYVRNLVENQEEKVVGRSVEDLVVRAKMAIYVIAPQEGRKFLPNIAHSVALGAFWEPVDVLAETACPAEQVIAVIEPLLKHESAQIQSKAAYIILHHDRNHASALATLRRNRANGDLNNRLFAGHLLMKSLGETNELRALVEEGFKAPESHIGQNAGQIADEMGDAALPCLPAFKAALWHPDQFVRERAGLLVLKLAPESLPIASGN